MKTVVDFSYFCNRIRHLLLRKITWKKINFKLNLWANKSNNFKAYPKKFDKLFFSFFIGFFYRNEKLLKIHLKNKQQKILLYRYKKCACVKLKTYRKKKSLRTANQRVKVGSVVWTSAILVLYIDGSGYNQNTWKLCLLILNHGWMSSSTAEWIPKLSCCKLASLFLLADMFLYTLIFEAGTL